MRIAIDATSICTPDGARGAGIGHYTYEAVRALLEASSRHTYLVFVPSSFRRDDEAVLLRGVRWAKVIRLPVLRVPGLARHVWLPLLARLRRCELLWAPAGELPLAWKGRSVITVHDVAVFTHPEWFRDEDRGNLSRRWIFPRSVEKATTIVTVSAFTQSELERVFPAAIGKTLVIHEGVALSQDVSTPTPEQRERWGLSEDTVLILGTIEPRKNLERALLAFDNYLQMHTDRAAVTRCILAGGKGWKSDGVFAEIERVNAAWRTEVPNGVVKWIGYVSEEEKWAVLAQASVLLYPSLEEGFGLPALEAMACGTTVIASDRGSLPEVTGDAAMQVNPEDVDVISLALSQALLMSDALKELRQAGLKQAAKFTWRKTAEGLLRVFEG